MRMKYRDMSKHTKGKMYEKMYENEGLSRLKNRNMKGEKEDS